MAVGPLPSGPGPAPAGAVRTVRYLGTTFTVPPGWRVIRLAAHPHQCVRFDRQVLYLGSPGQVQDCPAGLVGTTQAMLVQPSARQAVPRSVAYPEDRMISVVTRRITVTASYSTDPAQIGRVLAGAALRQPARASAGGPPPPGGTGAQPAGTRLAAPGVLPPTATSYTGQGFDACTAPSAAEMRAWRRWSPYRAVGIYIGGADRACAQPDLTASWVSQQQAAGWHFMPIYVGPQASLGEITAAVRQAVSAAQDAVSQARLLGFGPGAPIYYDMEAYPAALSGRVLRFLTAWTRELHTLQYTSGVYSNSLSGISDLASNYANPDYTMPDIIYDALWNGEADTQDPNVPATDWSRHQRVHQYLGGQNVSYGGDTINVDQDYLDVRRRALAGGSAQASPAAAQPAGAVDAFFRGPGGQLCRASFTPGAGWQRPVPMGGSLAGRPSAVTSVPGTVAVFAKGTDGRLWEAVSRPGAGWSALRPLGMGRLGSRPAAVARPDGVIDVFWRGSSDHHLWQARYIPGRGWAKPHDLGGQLRSGPAPAVSGRGTLTVFWTGTDGHLWVIQRMPRAAWGHPVNLGMGRLGGAPAATGLASGEVDVFWPARSHARVWQLGYLPGHGWGRARALPAGLTAGPVAVAAPATGVDVFWKGSNGKLWWAAGHGTSWAQPSQLRMGALGGAPFAAGQPSGVINVFWKGSADPHLWQGRYRNGTWSRPADLGGAVS
ncbi:MAG TPA: glycoside hydrolase domain-containing protein [Streptosporangiaceae bacterium]|nr:glycoside hydrolase domain-containing protein [Streptosporangiaceae bacterium]